MLTDPARGYYSNNKYLVLEQEQIGRIKDVGSEHAKQVAARDRAKKLSVETNRRRKALETKKKLEAEREAKRRQEVLEERRHRQRDATNRFQRQNKGSARRRQDFSHTAPAYPGAPLNEGVHMARGYRIESPSNHGSGTPSLDDVLQMVGVPTSLSLKYGQGYQTYQHNGAVPTSTYPTSANYGGNYVDNNANITPGSESRGHGKPTHSALHGVASQARTDSRTSLIEQEIAEQQQKLIEQQQRTLQEFSQAVQNEANKGGSDSVLQKSESLSSVDSLEENKREREDLTQNFGDRSHKVQTALGYGTSIGMQGASRYNSATDVKDEPSNYSLYHNDVLMRGIDDKRTKEQTAAQAAKTTNTASRNNSIYDSMRFNGVAFNGIVPTGGVSRQSATGSVQHVTQNAAHTGAQNVVQSGTQILQSRAQNVVQSGLQNGTTEKRTANNESGQDKKETAQAWSNSKSSKPPIHQHTSAPTASTTSQRSRPYSARTTATAVTVAPAVAYAPRGQENEAHHSSALATPATNMNDTYDGVGTAAPYRPHDRRFEEMPQEMLVPENDKGQEEEEDPVVVSPPKSILKWHKTETPTKDRKTKGLAAAIMKDSLEIGKQSGIRSPKKGVRWTDLTYSDDESVDTLATTETTTPATRKPRLISSVDARTVQERLGGKRDNVTGIPPRPKSGNVSAAKDRSQVQVKNNRYPNGQESRQTMNEKDKVATDKEPVVQNGIRLDKTPTDDEINWLWDKVRTCLHTRDEADQKNGHVSQASDARQPAAGSHPHDSRITANLRVAPPSNKPRFSQYNDTLRRHVIVPRYRTGSDSGSHVQQSAAPQQRRPHVRSSSASRATGQRAPEPSQQGPGRSATVTHNPEVTESLMAFQQAEQLVQQNADEADIAAVIDQPRQYHQVPQEKKVHPSALSIEEAKVLESLDRLNARLKTVTADMNGSFTPIYPMMPPKPPHHAAGFRGHRPMSSRPGAAGVTRPNHRMRAQSADRSSVRMGHHR